jgi:hypothetical protein
MKQNNWDKARKLKLIRREPGLPQKHTLEPGVNFFVAMLNQMGCDTYFSCEGHPGGFYIMFRAPYKLALRISRVGYFHYSIHEKETWMMESNDAAARYTIGPLTEMTKGKKLRIAAAAWEKEFGELDWKKVRKEI